MEWISVNDNLPENNIYVIGYECGAVYPVFFSDGIFYDGEHPYSITHWMPLPEPPKV